jgi:hypothetical protein
MGNRARDAQHSAEKVEEVQKHVEAVSTRIFKPDWKTVPREKIVSWCEQMIAEMEL